MERPLRDRSQVRREDLVERIVHHVLTNGLIGLSLRPLAKAVGTSDRMLLYYFKNKEELIEHVLDIASARLAEVLTSRMSPVPMPFERLQPILCEVVLADDIWPYMCLGLEISALAARGDPFYRALGARIGGAFLAWGAAQLESKTEGEREVLAARLLTAMEGALVLQSVAMGSVARKAMQ